MIPADKRFQRHLHRQSWLQWCLQILHVTGLGLVAHLGMSQSAAGALLDYCELGRVIARPVRQVSEGNLVTLGYPEGEHCFF
jgi:hypothetical protein